MENNKLIWVVQKLSSDSLSAECNTYYVKILDKNNYRSITSLWLDKQLYEKFQNIMKEDRYSLQYIEHEFLGEAAKIKLRQSPHHKIKSLTDFERELKDNEKEFYIGP